MHQISWTEVSNIVRYARIELKGQYKSFELLNCYSLFVIDLELVLIYNTYHKELLGSSINASLYETTLG